MSTAIYYFSGTGNSLYIARELQKRIPDAELIRLVSLLDQKSIRSHAKTVGIVFPVHALSVPIAVKRFLRKADLSSAGYIFAAATRLGLVFDGFDQVDRLLSRKGAKLSAGFRFNMGNNDVRGEDYKAPDPQELAAMEEELREQLDEAQRIITNSELCRQADTGYLKSIPYNLHRNRLLERFIIAMLWLSEYIGGVNYYCSDARCNGCGVCQRVCLSRKIRMSGKKPVWQRKTVCYMCYACVNYCPQQAVQIDSIPGVKSHTRQTGRYPHPYATVKDIAGQKGDASVGR